MDNLRVLILCPDGGAKPQFGPNIRMRAFARVLAARFKVTLAYNQAADSGTLPVGDGYETVAWQRTSVTSQLQNQDVVVSLGMQYPARLMIRSKPLQVFDLYDPVIFEQLASPQGASAPLSELQHLARLTRYLLQRGDFFLCASQQQRDLWLGSLYTSGRLSEYGPDSGMLMDRMIAVVPFGHDGSRPTPTRRVLKGVIPGIEKHDRVLLWGGGLWNWFDPEILIEAMAEIALERNDVKLFFISSRHPDAGFSANDKMKLALRKAEETHTINKCVFFHDSWVEYEDRVNYLLEADLAVCTAPDTLENHFSYRTRLVDAVWAGIPIIVTRAGAFADVVEKKNLGFTVEAGNVADLKKRILMALTPDTHERFRENLEAARDELRWEQCAQPLVRFCSDVANGTVQPRNEGSLRAGLQYAQYKFPAVFGW